MQVKVTKIVKETKFKEIWCQLESKNFDLSETILKLIII